MNVAVCYREVSRLTHVVRCPSEEEVVLQKGRVFPLNTYIDAFDVTCNLWMKLSTLLWIRVLNTVKNEDGTERGIDDSMLKIGKRMQYSHEECASLLEARLMTAFQRSNY